MEGLYAKIHAKISQGIPGEDAHFIMAPYGRKMRDEALKLDPNPKLSAVLALLFLENDEYKIVLTKRKEYPGVHSGQISFPGGKKEPEDQDLLDTALRETHEEIGIQKDLIQIICPLTELYIPPSRFLVRPYLGFVKSVPQFVKEESEVAEIITPSLELILDDSTLKNGTFSSGYENFKVTAPYFDIYGHKVWGATSMILSEIKQILIDL